MSMMSNEKPSRKERSIRKEQEKNQVLTENIQNKLKVSNNDELKVTKIN